MNDRSDAIHVKSVYKHWFHAIVTFAVAVLAGSVLLPLIRTSPEQVHSFFAKLPNEVRIAFGVFLCLLFAHAAIKLLAPRRAHLNFGFTHPPAWAAFLIAAGVVAWLDMSGKLDVDGFDLLWWHWPLYGLIPLAYAIIASGMLTSGKDPQSDTSGGETDDSPETESSNTLLGTAESVESASWEEIETWLKSDASAKYDFLQNRDVAKRLSNLFRGQVRSVGLVGPYGAGKTSIVEWIESDLRRPSKTSPRFLVCKFSCWGFETSASVIHEMLADAIARVSLEIDTFDVESLPDSYRQTFAAAGDWFDRVSQILLGKRSPDEQFQRLSELLSPLNARILFIVEDLDRNDTRSFETEEVLAFLERLKQYKNLSFLLTGGLGSTIKIDFAKLCDHIETLRLVDSRLAASLIRRVHARCRDVKAFPHIPIQDEDERTHWGDLSDSVSSELEEMTIQQAVASLLQTPRALRHSLQRTHSAWSRLCGEVNLDQLIVLNVIRYGAPEAFDWLLSRWARFRSPPTKRNYGVDRSEQFKESMQNQWQVLIRDADWNPQAVQRAIEFILPASTAWLTDSNGYSLRISQPLSEGKYWIRAVNEAFSPGSITDQQVARDEKAWNEGKSPSSDFVVGLSTSPDYSEAWVNLAGKQLGIKSEDCTLLLTQVFDRICAENGVAASVHNGTFLDVWKITDAYSRSASVRHDWLEKHFAKAANVSLRMTSDLWHQFRINQHGGETVNRNLRISMINAIKASVDSGDRLNELLDPDYPYTLYHLVFDSGKDERPIGEVLADWGWIARPIQEAIEAGDETTILEAAILCAGREDGSRTSPPRVDRNVFVGLFDNDAQQVVDAIRSAGASSKERQSAINQFANAAQEALDQPEEPPVTEDTSGQPGDSDVAIESDVHEAIGDTVDD